MIRDSRLTQTQPDHWGNLLQFLEDRLRSDALCQHQLVDIVSRVVAHVHRRTAALDTGPRSQVADGKVVVGIGDSRWELQPASLALVD